MAEENSSPTQEKTCVVWSHRQTRQIALRVQYQLREEDGCRIYTLCHVQELK